MKHVFTVFTSLLLLLVSGAHAQQWTWLTGGNTPNVLPNYLDDPGGRQGSAMWSGNDGKVYVFGGNNFEEGFFYADLWAYDTLAQQWTFVSGSQEANAYGIYGMQGISDAMSRPGARQQAASWVDNNGNLWLFGGLGYGATTGYGELNDLWMYSVQTGLWTWVSGSSETNSYGMYGELGVPASSNSPGSRHECAFWLLDNDLYLFGGSGLSSLSIGYLNDLWKYSIQDNQWVYLSGSMTADVQGNYGSQNIPSATNQPGARAGSCQWASENNSMLFLFGGSAAITTEQLNDLWQYDVTTNTWTWISGTSVGNHPGVSGELGVPSVNNIPAGRLQAVSFAQNNYLWLFGGYTNYYINDLWRYSLSTGEWTWMGGSTFPGDTGFYIEQGPSAFPNYPSNKEAATGCVSDNGKFWLFGGTGSVGGVMNDLWKLEVAPDAPALTCNPLPANLQQGLVGYWPFCGNANDESGNGLNGQLVYDNLPTLTSDRFGNANSAYSVSTVGNGIILPAPAAGTFASGEMTYSIWYNEVVSDDFMHILTAAGKPLLLGYNSNGIRAYDGNSFYVEALSSDLSVGGWKNIIAVYQQDTISVYINGGLAVSQTTGFDSAIPYFDAECLLGLTSGGMYPFLGQIDDAALWNRALNAEEVANYYGSTSPPTACAASIMQGDTTLCGGTSLTLSVALSSNDANSGEGITDVDGNFYPTIGIGDRTWMQKNLDVSHYRNGDVIPQVTDFNEWALLTTGAWCWYNNDSATYAATYGKIYNWYAVNDPRGLAPEGYEIPSNSDFGMLTVFIDPSANAGCSSCNFSETAGGALKEAGTTNWYENSGASNSSQFTALPGGVRNETEFLYQSYLARFWSSTEAGAEEAYLMSLSYDATYAASNVFYKNWGHSVRCIKSNNVSYAWSTGDTTAAIYISPLESATYYCTITDQLGNICTDSVHVTVNSCANDCPTLDPALQNGLVGYWPFCGNATDESGNGNNGVVNGAALAEDRFGNAESAYELNGSDEYISVSSDSIALLPSEEITLSVWFKIDADGAYSGNNLLGPLMRSRFYGYVAWYDTLSTSIQVITHHDNNGEIIGSDTRTPSGVNDNNWHLLTSTFNGAVSNLYLDGALVDSYAISGNLYYVPDGIVAFGRDGNNPSPLTAHYAGKLDDIGIWNRALTAEEVALLYGNFTQTIPGCTDPSAFNYNPQANQNEGCLYTASVFVYNDLNGNGEHESNEPGLSNWPVVGNDINGLLWTNGNGNAFVAVPQGGYQFTVLNTTDNWVSTTEASGIVAVGNSCIDQAGNPAPCPNSIATISFGLQVIPGEAIVAAGPFTGFWEILHCTDGYESGVYLENIGSQTVSGFMTLTCDPLFTPNASSYFTTPPVETGPGYALWNIADFLPGEYELLSYFVPGPGVEYLNAVFNFSLELTLLDPQGNIIFDETWNVSPVVACAYDPNDLTGFPETLSHLPSPENEGYTIEHFVREDEMVEFRVRFQNTGTLPAEDIDIYIPIDASVWDLSTIEPLARAADMQVLCLHDGGDIDFSLYDSLEHELPEGVSATDLLIFSFEDIFLPDSASDPDGSQGYVFFQMQAKHGLDVNTELNAQAFIYFEQNPPITTNETYHVIFDCNSFTPMVGDAEICDGESLIFDATQPYVDAYEWQLNNVVIGSADTLQYPAEVGTYTLELNTKNVLCSPGENHEVTVIVHEIPELDLPLNATVCEGEELNYEAESNGSVTWSNGANTGDTFTADQSFTVTATATGEGNCSTSEDWMVTVNPLPSAAVDSANFVLTAIDGVAWQWSVNGAVDATTQSITATVNGNYQVEITNEFGCVAISDVIEVELPSSVFVHSWSTLHLYPNPMTTGARLELPQGTFDVALYDITGACIRTLSKQQGTVVIERESLASGVYQVRATQGTKSSNIRLVIK